MCPCRRAALERFGHTLTTYSNTKTWKICSPGRVVWLTHDQEHAVKQPQRAEGSLGNQIRLLEKLWVINKINIKSIHIYVTQQSGGSKSENPVVAARECYLATVLIYYAYMLSS